MATAGSARNHGASRKECPPRVEKNTTMALHTTTQVNAAHAAGRDQLRVKRS